MNSSKQPAGGRVTKRPSIIDDYIQTSKTIAERSKHLSEIRPGVAKILEVNTYDDLKRIEVISSPKVDADLATKWLKWLKRNKKITREQFEDLFINVLNSDAFITFIKRNRSLKALMPKKKKVISFNKSFQIRTGK